MSDNDYTTIPVREETKERLNAERDGRPWDQYLESLRRESADPLTLATVDEIADALAERLED